MYYETFGLKEPPFQLTPDSRYLFFSHIHKRAKAYMDYAVWKRDGFIVLTGEIGAGKTTLINKLLSEIDNDVEVIRIFQTQLNEVEFLQAMLFEIGVNASEIHGQGKVELLHRLNDYLINTYAKGKHVVLIIDEGQNLTSKVLEEIRMLSGLELDKEKLLNIILVGQPEMNHILDQPNMVQLVQRIRLRFHLGPLKENETIQYVEHRLSVAGSKDPKKIFADSTYKTIQQYSGGIPRKLNVLCDTALVCAFADNKKIIDLDTIKDAIDELQWDKDTQKVTNKTHVKHPAIENSTSETKISAPSFTVRDQQWSDMFSALLNVIGDNAERMKTIEKTMKDISDRLDNFEPDQNSKKVISISEKNSKKSKNGKSDIK